MSDVDQVLLARAIGYAVIWIVFPCLIALLVYLEIRERSEDDGMDG